MSRYDLNSNYSTQEVLVLNSVGSFILQVFITIILFAFTFFVYKITTDYIIIFFLALISIYSISKNVLYFKSINEIQLRINDRGVQYKDMEIIPWVYIENERVERIKIGKSREEYFIYYIKNMDKVIKLNLENISIPGNDLVSLFNYFRNKSIS